MSAISVKTEHGLIKGHAYTILGVVNLQNNGEESMQLVKMRSPWIYSNEIWSGKWNVKDARWTKNYKKQVKFSYDSSDGIFFMTFDDFQDHFEEYNVAIYSHHLVQNSVV